ncbi:hypothetical protein GCM10011610_16330 [Nocardia rhizosphaerihabitans]|uniref:Uncharacterized protein n=1 Tax=Nocardia rhizosphaerihabitans TaxID=1691570 RepID=A0ABQ2K791_9NOCA|nr:hypothetical protein GCM10011610_16330 [Nocardia rhizosphaerihabitans]
MVTTSSIGIRNGPLSEAGVDKRNKSLAEPGTDKLESSLNCTTSSGARNMHRIAHCPDTHPRRPLCPRHHFGVEYDWFPVEVTV